MRRFVTLALSLSLVLGLSAAGSLLAQEEVKVQDQPAATGALKQKVDTPATESKEAASPAADTPKADASAAEKKEETKPAATPAAETPLPSIPPEVEAKLEAARKAVAEAIVAAQDAGLVETSIDPPPILDILITGRATDLRTLKAVTKENPEAGVSPEVFGAWYTGYGKAVEGITAEKNIRIIQPAKGLKDWYASRAAFLNKYIEEARAAKPAPAPAAEGEKKEEPAPAAEGEKKEEAAPAAEGEKKEEAAPAEEKKPDEPKDEAKPADEEKKTEEAPKAEEAAPADAAPKAEEAPQG